MIKVKIKKKPQYWDFFIGFLVSLDSEQHRNNHRPFRSFLEQMARDGVGHIRFDQFDVDRVHTASSVFDSLLDQIAGVAKKVLGLAQIDEAAGNDVR